jgi:hypothetical protein
MDWPLLFRADPRSTPFHRTRFDRSDTLAQSPGMAAGGCARAGLTRGGRVVEVLEENPRCHVKHGLHDAVVIPTFDELQGKPICAFPGDLRSQRYYDFRGETPITWDDEACGDPGRLGRDGGEVDRVLRM